MAVTLDKLEIRQGAFALRGDVTFAPGQSTAIIGPSGGGKSTLLLALAGFIAPVAGRVLINGQDQQGRPPAKRPLTMIFQENNLFAHLSLFQNAALGLCPDLKLDAGQRAQVHAALDRVGLSGRAQDRPANLSGGQRQRVALARAMLRPRAVLLLDEPFSGLGPALRHEMLDLFEKLRAEQGASLLMVTHNPDDARRIAKSVAVVANGKVDPPRATAELFADPPAALRDYLGD